MQLAKFDSILLNGKTQKEEHTTVEVLARHCANELTKHTKNEFNACKNLVPL